MDRRRQHRAQHHHHPLELPLQRKRRALRSLSQALGEPLAGIELQRHVLAARRDDARAHGARHPGRQTPRACQSLQRRRQRMARARTSQAILSAAEHRTKHSLSRVGRRPAAARRHRAPRRGCLGVRARSRCVGCGHHRKLRGDRHPTRRGRCDRGARNDSRAHPFAQGRRLRRRPHQRHHGDGRAYACPSRASRCRRWYRSRSNPFFPAS